MVDFLIIGTIAWDRPVYIKGHLQPGARLLGQSIEGSLSGRLGGGAANAGSALIGAGHTVGIGSFVRDNEEGEDILRECLGRGLDISLVSKIKSTPKGKSIILIDASGERSVLYLDYKTDQLDAFYKVLANQAPALTEIQAMNPRAVFARGPHPGFDEWLTTTDVPVLAHWPWKANAKVPANVLVGSADDLGLSLSSSSEQIFSAARDAATDKLEWALVTDGKKGVVATNGTDRFESTPPKVVQVDSTGAGDIFAAGFLEAWMSGGTISEALDHGCSWGAECVQIKNSSPDKQKQSFFKRFTKV
jgi:sugar/nucleoside kinase (ribokinase family)